MIGGWGKGGGEGGEGGRGSGAGVGGGREGDLSQEPQGHLQQATDIGPDTSSADNEASVTDLAVAAFTPQHAGIPAGVTAYSASTAAGAH